MTQHFGVELCRRCYHDTVVKSVIIRLLANRIRREKRSKISHTLVSGHGQRQIYICLSLALTNHKPMAIFLCL